MRRVASRAAHWVVDWAIAYSVVALVLIVFAGAVYAVHYHRVMTAEEIVDDDLTLVSLIGDTLILHIQGTKREGYPLVETRVKPCPASGWVATNGALVSCKRGEKVVATVSPSAYGVRSDGARREVPMRPAPGSTPNSYPQGRFDAGHWIVDISPRFPGDPPIVGIDIEVTHQRPFGEVTEMFDRFAIYAPPG